METYSLYTTKKEGGGEGGWKGGGQTYIHIGREKEKKNLGLRVLLSLSLDCLVDGRRRRCCYYTAVAASSAIASLLSLFLCGTVVWSQSRCVRC
jgi:hypothetical protein